VLEAFGDRERLEAECVEIGMERIQRQRRAQMMVDVIADVRYALRTFRRNPLFALVAVLTLGLGLGAATAVFTVVDRVALRDLPLPEPERLFVVWETNPQKGAPLDNPSPPNLYDWRARTRTFAALAAWMATTATLGGLDRPQVLEAYNVSANLFPTLGVAPIQGRHFTPEEERPEGTRTVMLGYAFWQGIFGGRPMVGEAISLNGMPHEVIGILPAGLELPVPDVDVWLPALLADPDEHRQARYLNVGARLAPGFTPEAARRDINRVHAELSLEHPDANGGWEVALVPAKDQVVGDTGRLSLVVLVAVGLVLLIACANVANLLLGRMAARERELGIRAAIGASGNRLRRQVITESVTLGALGGLLGLAVAQAVLSLFLRLEPGLPRMSEVAIDARILGFVVLGSVLCAVLFGLAPAREVIGGAHTLRDGKGPREAARTRRILVTSEVALSVVLLIVAGTFVLSFQALLSVDPGFEREGVVAAKISLDEAAYPTSQARLQYFEALVTELSQVPGVADVAVTSSLPMDPTGTDFDLARQAEGHPVVSEGDAPQTDYRIVSPGYVETLGLEVMQGREFTSFDRAETRPVLMITESLARALWPGESPIGKTITIHYLTDRAWEVVGVVNDTRNEGLSVPPSQQMFVPLAQAEYLFGYMTVVLRASTNAPLALDAVRDAAVRVDPNQPLFQIETMEQLIDASVARDRIITWSVGSLAILALLLAAAGVYAVISYQVAQRTREIGVRMALGASRRRVVREVLSGAMALAGAGAAAGLAISLVAGRAGQSLVFGTVTWEPAIFLTVPGVLLVVAGLAATVPALRAAGVDPATAMRSE